MRLALTACAILLLACSDSDSSTGTTSGSSSGASSSGSSASAVSLDASNVFKGTLTLTGTITLPPGSGSGKSIQLTVSGGGGSLENSGSQLGPAGKTPGESVPYTITGLVEGQYSVRARVDQNGDANLASPGDLDGFTGGTVDAPVTDVTKAKKVDVKGTGATGVDFGIGKLP